MIVVLSMGRDRSKSCMLVVAYRGERNAQHKGKNNQYFHEYIYIYMDIYTHVKTYTSLNAII